MPTFRRVPRERWDELPAPVAKKAASEWDSLLDQVATGELVEVDRESNKTLRGMQIVISKQAHGRGFAVDYRIDGDKLYVLRSGEYDAGKKGGAAKSGSQGGKGPGRPPKSAQSQPEPQPVAAEEGE